MARTIVAVVLASALGLAGGVALSQASRRPARTILAELDAIRLPGGFLDDEQVRELESACRRRAELELELYDTWPRHARVSAALEERWAFLENTFAEHERVLAETETVLARTSTGPLARRALHARAWSSLHAESVPAEECLRRIDAARPRALDDDPCASSLLWLVGQRTADPALQAQLCRRVLAAPAIAGELRREAQRLLRLCERTGKPLGLDFVDEQTGEPASLAPALGKPLLVCVRAAADWKPLTETDLDALEERHRVQGLFVLELVLGRPDAPAQRSGRRLVAPEDWREQFGFVSTPCFLAVDAGGKLAAWSLALRTAESGLEARE